MDKLIRVSDKDGVMQTLVPGDAVSFDCILNVYAPYGTFELTARMTFKNRSGVLAPLGPFTVIAEKFKATQS
jgi:hypothetical protein